MEKSSIYIKTFNKIMEYINSNENGNNCKLITTEEEFFNSIHITGNNDSHTINLKIQCGTCDKKEIFITTFRNFKYKNKRQCNDCSNKAIHLKQTKTHDEFENEINKLVGNEYSIITRYINAKEKILIRHNSDKCNNHEWYVKPNNFLNGSRCPVCKVDHLSEIHRIDGNVVYKDYIEKGLIPQFKPSDYVNSHTPMPFICELHTNKGIQYISYSDLKNKTFGCKFCGYENNSGKNSYMWKGGVSNLNQYLRCVILDWKNSSIQNCNYKCIITKNRFKNVHHLVGFEFIRDQILKDLNLDIREEINKYSEEELKLLEEKCIELHSKTLLGVCLCDEIHKLFHSNYGYGENTPTQFKEFITRLEQNEFDDFLKENNLTLNINYEVLNKLLN